MKTIAILLFFTLITLESYSADAPEKPFDGTYTKKELAHMQFNYYRRKASEVLLFGTKKEFKETIDKVYELSKIIDIPVSDASKEDILKRYDKLWGK